MTRIEKKVILHSPNGCRSNHDELLQRLINEEISLFCVTGKDCELWQDVMDEMFVGNGEERNFKQITTWHEDETLDEVIKFAKNYKIAGIDNDQLTIIEI